MKDYNFKDPKYPMAIPYRLQNRRLAKVIDTIIGVLACLAMGGVLGALFFFGLQNTMYWS